MLREDPLRSVRFRERRRFLRYLHTLRRVSLECIGGFERGDNLFDVRNLPERSALELVPFELSIDEPSRSD